MKLHTAPVYAEDVAAHDPRREGREGVGERMGTRGRNRNRERREEGRGWEEGRREEGGKTLKIHIENPF